MSEKIQMNGKRLCQMSVDDLKTYANGDNGKRRHKARKELNRRGIDWKTSE